MGRAQLIELAADPDVLNALLIFLVADVFYRLFAMLDAYRLATDSAVGSGFTRLLSTGGLVAVIVVLVGSHVAVAQPVFLATGVYASIVENAGDESEVLTAEELAELGGEDFELITEEQRERPNGEGRGNVEGPGAERTPKPTATVEATPEPTEASEPTPTPRPQADWNGTERLNILLIGQDGGRQGRNDASLLTDTMITVSIDPVTGRLAFISLPRDTSNIPLPREWPAHRALGGKWNNKINTLYVQARANSALFPGSDKERGYKALMGALGELYGLDIKYYVSVDLNSFLWNRPCSTTQLPMLLHVDLL
jgi:hypothetical protein